MDNNILIPNEASLLFARAARWGWRRSLARSRLRKPATEGFDPFHHPGPGLPVTRSADRA